jgi:hypothetical protein
MLLSGIHDFDQLITDKHATTRNFLQAGASTGSARTEYQCVKRISVRPEPVEGQLLRVHQNWIPDQKRLGNDTFSVQRKISANQVSL